MVCGAGDDAIQEQKPTVFFVPVHVPQST